jgi:hypothetical protein
MVCSRKTTTTSHSGVSGIAPNPNFLDVAIKWRNHVCLTRPLADVQRQFSESNQTYEVGGSRKAGLLRRRDTRTESGSDCKSALLGTPEAQELFKKST